MSSRHAFAAFLLSAFWLAAADNPVHADCSLTSTGQIPLPDLAGSYRGMAGGLYPDGASVRPVAHEALGLQAASQIQPLNAQGQPDPAAGRIALISIGMSNTNYEFGRFTELIGVDPSRNPRLVVVNGAQANQTADRYRDPASTAWQWAFDEITRRGVTRNQVQAAWVKVVIAGFGSNTTDPAANFPSFPQALQADLETISRNLKINFPNIKVAYFSSRIRAYVTPRGLSPEPTAYETGFAVRGAVSDQIHGTGNVGLNVAPWMSWGPYLWADGLTPRSDGLTYACSDLEADFTHPATGGIQKVADQLRAFFSTDPTATTWFLKTPSNPPAVQALSASPQSGDPGVRVRFAVSATDTDGIRDYLWNFGDGTSASGRTPQKTFSIPGRYPVRVAIIDQLGNASVQTLTVSVGAVTTVPEAPANLRITP